MTIPAHVTTESVPHGHGFGYRAVCRCGWRGTDRFGRGLDQTGRGQAQVDAMLHAGECDGTEAAERPGEAG